MSSDTKLEKQDNASSTELLTLQEDHQYAYSMAVLAAQERDREAERMHYRKTQRDALVFLV